MRDKAGMTDSLRPGLFAGRTALVTGGGSGIGRVIARRFAALGAQVVLAGRHQETLAAAQDEIGAAGGTALAHPTDIRQVDQVDALVKAALDRFGRIDFVVNNAGGQFPARPSEISDRGWRAVVDLNLNGTWNVLSRVGPHLLAQRFGAVVNVVHVYVFGRGAPTFAHSGAARAGVVNLTRSLAAYWARHDVTINALAPGSIDTTALREKEYAALMADYEAQQKKDIPAHRLGTPEEMAEICAFLCSPAARYINGSVIVADGAQYLGAWSDPWDMEKP
jgi:NAD(P)-dependent dehydrogenase (short-subunit alcohol dehydrogenase family)